VIALCPNGLTRDVTDENKWEYASLLAKWKTTYAVSALLEPFLKGFYELIPLKILQENQLTFEELDEMLNGKAAVDIEELRAYVMYQGNKDFDEKHEAVVWFWQIIRECDDSNKRSIIKFFTGSTRVPLDGYDPPLNITQGVDMVEDSLPRAHTCFNQLVLPAYSSYTLMKEKISEVARGVNGSNHQRTVDTAKLMKVNLMNAHTTCDNLAAKFLKNYIDLLGSLYNLYIKFSNK
jgi:E3 ubiquitin-protein ligase HUWE1